MLDTKLIKVQSGAVHIITFKGSTVVFVFDDDGSGALLDNSITFAGQVRDMNNTLIGSFSFVKDYNNKYVKVVLSDSVTSTLTPLDKYYSVQEIVDNEYNLHRYKYDIELYDANNQTVSKLIYGFVYVLPEVTVS